MHTLPTRCPGPDNIVIDAVANMQKRVGRGVKKRHSMLKNPWAGFFHAHFTTDNHMLKIIMQPQPLEQRTQAQVPVGKQA